MVAEAPGCCADYVSQAATAPSGHKVTSLLTFPLKESLPRNLLRSCWVDWAGRCGWVLSARSDHQCHLQWVDGDPAIHGVPLQRLYVTRVVWHWKHIFMVHRSGSRRWKWADLVLRYSVHPGLPGAFLALALKNPTSWEILPSLENWDDWSSHLGYSPIYHLSVMNPCRHGLASLGLHFSSVNWASLKSWSPDPSQFWDPVLPSRFASSVRWEN